MGEASADILLRAPVGVRRSSTYLPELEALRGIAITLVFLHHAIGKVEGLCGITIWKVYVKQRRAGN